MRLKNKVAIVTGSGAGIGRTTAILFSEEGAKTIVVDIDRKAGQQTVDMIRDRNGDAQFVPTDITDSSQVKSMANRTVDAYGRLDILVNNAGVFAQGDTVETEETLWDRIMNLNLRAAFLCCKYSIPQMIKTGSGTIINVSSEAGIVAWKKTVAYGVSKAGLIHLTKMIAVDFASQNIRANCVCPGTTETPGFWVKEDSPEEAYRRWAGVRPANRLGKPEETAYGIVYLASDESRYATGAVLSIDGGYVVQ